MNNLETGSENVGFYESHEVKKMNFIKRVSGVIFSPSETMKNLAEKPRVLFPIILMAVSMFLFILVNFEMFKEFNLITIEETMAKMNLELTSEQLATQAEFGSKISLFTTPLVTLVTWFIGGVILFAAMKIFKGEGKLKQYLSVTGYSYVIAVLSLIVTSIVANLTGTFNMYASVTGLTSLLPQDMSGTFLYGFLSIFEVFNIWQYVVMGIGAAYVSKLDKKKVYVIMTALFVLTGLYGGTTQIIGSMFK